MQLILRALVAVTFVALAGCGKSADTKREDIVRCGGFSLTLIKIQPGSPLESATESALTKGGISANDTLPLGGAAQTYAATMDPAKVSRLSQEGSSSASDLIRTKDANGIVDYLKSCVATYKDLGR
jgi:hypothetical protein